MSTPPPAEPVRFAVLAADTALFTLHDGQLFVRLITVDRPPYYPAGSLGLPGGLLDPKETAEEAAVRHLEAKTGIAASKLYVEQLYTFSEVGRDPRGRVVAVAYLALVPWESLSEAEREGNPQSWWSQVGATGPLAYDHNRVLELALSRLRSRVRYTTLISRLMPAEFTLTDLEKAYARVFNESLDKRNFRKKILKLGILTPSAHKRTGERSRPAQLYSFTAPEIREIEIL